MEAPGTITIDLPKCNGCGVYVKVCPSDYLSLKEDKAVVTGDRCIGCGHCEAAC